MAHLPYRNWWPIRVQARGKQSSHPKQHSKLPIIQLDIGYIKGFDDSNVYPILTAIDIQSGVIMAIQLTDERMLFKYAVTQLGITRRSRASARNTVCASQNTQGTDQAKLRQRHFNETSTHALDSSTRCIHHEQVCSPQQWMHKLLQQME